jgi:hypothetical protein
MKMIGAFECVDFLLLRVKKVQILHADGVVPFPLPLCRVVSNVS